MGTGAAFAANAATDPSAITKDDIVVAPWFSVSFVPTPEIYAPSEAFGITISADGKDLLYNGQPVRQFVDEKAESWAFYLDENGTGNFSAARNAAGEITGIESISSEKAKQYYKGFFAEELDPNSLDKVYQESLKDLAEDLAKENVQEGGNKYEKYQPFGLTCSVADGVLTFKGQRVKFFIDWFAAGGPDAMWEDEAGTVNVAAVRGTSGQLTGVESISDEKVREYKTRWDDSLVGLDERAEAKVNAMYAED